MGRPRNNSDDRILAAYERTDSTKALAKALKISLPSAYHQLHRLQLKPKVAPRAKRAVNRTDMTIFKAYRGLVSVADVARATNRTQPQVRDALRRVIDQYDWSGARRPRHLSDVRIYHALERNPRATAQALAAATGFSVNDVREYLELSVEEEK